MFRVSNDTAAHGLDLTLGVGTNANRPELILPPGKRRALTILNRDKEKIVLSVDFVEFADGPPCPSRHYDSRGVMIELKVGS